MAATAQLDERAACLRIVAASDAARRRIERELHDGPQQRLVVLAIKLGLARASLGEDQARMGALLDDAIDELAATTCELRELARDIHPAVLTEAGLEAALSGLAARCPLPVTITGVQGERFAAHVEATAYFVVAEALAEVARHPGATLVDVALARRGTTLAVQVRGDGRGGGARGREALLRGLGDRVAALGGVLTIERGAGAGTRVRAEIPCAS